MRITLIINAKLFNFIGTSRTNKAKTPLKYCKENDDLYN